MLELTRTVRFCLDGDGGFRGETRADNTYAAWPAMRGLGRYYELLVTCRGEADPETGYFVNIKEIDRAAREFALPVVSGFAKREVGGEVVGYGEVMGGVLGAMVEGLGGKVVAVEMRLTPSYGLKIEVADMSSVLMSQQFEFAAAHRLHAASLSDEENRRVFGKCNNVEGHGHNYRVEVNVRCGIGEGGGGPACEVLDEVVNREAIDKLDHKNLDRDVAELAGRNTSVEHIAEVVYGMLLGPIGDEGMELVNVRVWETGKTVCTYPG